MAKEYHLQQQKESQFVHPIQHQGLHQPITEEEYRARHQVALMQKEREAQKGAKEPVHTGLKTLYG